MKLLFEERSGTIGYAGVSYWLGGVFLVGMRSNPDGAQLGLLYFSTLSRVTTYVIAVMS